MRRFNLAWFDKYKWQSIASPKIKHSACDVIYSEMISQNKVEIMCLFVIECFSCWDKPESLFEHVSGTNIFHKIAVNRCDDLIHKSILHSLYK